MKIFKWIFAVIGTVIVGSLAYYFLSVSGQVLEVSWNKVRVEKMERMGGLDEYELKRKGLNVEQVQDVLAHPERYRYVIYPMTLNNHSSMTAVANMEVRAQLPEELQKRLVWIDDEFKMLPYLGPSEKRPDGVYGIYRLEEGETEQNLLDMVKKTRFTITGQKIGRLFNHGTFSITVTYSGI